MNPIEVIPCGTAVTTKIGKVEGIIVGIKIEFKAIIYNISYFTGDCFKNYEMSEEEFDVSDLSNKQMIGLKKQHS
ncbi:MAG: hypothetical protein KA954_01225 [Chitinophagales bacterium]|nr:hypothetical protein [Chitinophagales bacterium]MBP9845846.1 hypothetical protein [Saprospiraceae bacterium]